MSSEPGHDIDPDNIPPDLLAAALDIFGDMVEASTARPAMTAGSSYGSSTVKRRRRSKADLADLDAAVVAAVAADHPVSLRGVYYRVVSAGAVEKTENGYRAVGRRLLKLRRDGTVPYGHITDGTRYVLRRPSWADPEAALDALAASYRRALWLDQPTAVQLFTEKDAICGVIEPVAARWDVPVGVVRGYSSETFAYEMAAALPASQRTVIYQLGDHDPSGVNAWKVFCQRVRGFAPEAPVTFERLAVTEDQIRDLSLPTRPTKGSDSRAKAFTGESVEVDAIPAGTLREIVETAITAHVDPHALELHRTVEAQERDGLAALAAGGWPL